jgi:hypothetical protein
VEGKAVNLLCQDNRARIQQFDLAVALISSIANVGDLTQALDHGISETTQENI